MKYNFTDQNNSSVKIPPPVNAYFLIIRYLVAFGLIGGLVLGNYLILRLQIENSRFAGLVYMETEQQRSRLQDTALLSEKLMIKTDPAERAAVKDKIGKMLAALEAAHRKLVNDESSKGKMPSDVHAIYFAQPWMLDSHMHAYIAEACSLMQAPDNELNWLNPHFLYIDRAAMSGKMVDALNRVAAVYQSQSREKTDFLEWLAYWSVGSTIGVLAISGLWIVHPRVRRMQKDMQILHKYNDSLKRLAAIGNMVAGVAHESRNFLQQMQACVGLLEDKIGGSEDAKSLLADLSKAHGQLHRLFEDLRGYVAPVTLNFQACDLRIILNDAWNSLDSFHANLGATMRIHPSATDASCRADPLRIEQVFRNILENSLETGVNPLVVEADFSAAILNGSPAIRIILRDNGPGFDPEREQHAFEPFHTTKNHGSGLGLAIVKRIIEAHQGEITLLNRCPRGAEFHIVLPHKNP